MLTLRWTKKGKYWVCTIQGYTFYIMDGSPTVRSMSGEPDRNYANIREALEDYGILHRVQEEQVSVLLG